MSSKKWYVWGINPLLGRAPVLELISKKSKMMKLNNKTFETYAGSSLLWRLAGIREIEF